MEFLYKLYSNSYFGIGLFIVITILAFSFLEILFFGKKDEKTRNAQKLENQGTNILEESLNQVETPKENLEPISLNENIAAVETVEKEEPVRNIEMVQEEYNPFIDNRNDKAEFTYNKEESSAPMEIAPVENDDSEFISDIFTLNQPKEMLEEQEETSFVYEEKPNREPARVEEPTYDYNYNNIFENTPIFDEPKEENIFTEPKEEEPIRPTRPISSSPFSSVYLNKSQELEAQKEEIKKEEPAPSNNNVRPIPVKPTFELPKKVDLPKLNKGSETTNQNIINPAFTEKKSDGINNIFGNLEEESYTINK